MKNAILISGILFVMSLASCSSSRYGMVEKYNLIFVDSTNLIEDINTGEFHKVYDTVPVIMTIKYRSNGKKHSFAVNNK